MMSLISLFGQIIITFVLYSKTGQDYKLFD